MTSGFRLLLLSAAALAFCLPSGAEESPRLPPAVHPRRNVEEFPPVEARFVRMTILRTARLVEPCLDEFEIYGPDAPGENLALAEEGTRTRASGTLDAYRIHALKHVNDGLYGNARSWICDTVRDGWVELELPAPARIDRIVWSRDRQGKFIDRLPVDYRIEVALEPGEWHLVASSSGRTPLSAVASTNPGLPYDLDNSLRYSPWGLTAPAGEAPDPPRAAGREYVISTWNTTHGLPSNTVTALSQTRDAWLWVGTSNGLARFDGVHFTAYGENDGLPSLSVGALCNDALGGLWVGTLGGGLARWDGRRFRPVATGASAEARIVVSLAADADGTVWAATLDGLFECRGDAVVRHMGGQQIPDVACNRTQAGAWFYPLGDGLCHIADGKITKIDPTLERSLFSSLVALAAGQAGEVWFGGANRYVGRFADGEAMAFAETAALTSTVWEILPALCGDVWLGTSASGLLRLRDGAILSITTEDGLPSNGTPALCEDAEGNLWAGTTGGGLARLSPRRVDALTPGDGLSHRAVIALAEDADGAVWIGTNGGGLNRWHDGRVEPVSPSYVLENETIAALVPAAVADGGGLWISTAFSGLARLTGDGIEFVSTFGGNPGHAIGAVRRRRCRRIVGWHAAGCLPLSRWRSGDTRRTGSTGEPGDHRLDARRFRRIVDWDQRRWCCTLGGQRQSAALDARRRAAERIHPHVATGRWRYAVGRHERWPLPLAGGDDRYFHQRQRAAQLGRLTNPRRCICGWAPTAVSCASPGRRLTTWPPAGPVCWKCWRSIPPTVCRASNARPACAAGTGASASAHRLVWR